MLGGGGKTSFHFKIVILLISIRNVAYKIIFKYYFFKH